MSHTRQFAAWIAIAVVAVVGLFVILQMQYQPTQARFALAVNAHPAVGRSVFEAKGCARCHGIDAAGGPDGPSLRNRASLTSLPRLVTALWNHVPRMSQAMAAAHMSYPAMTNEETAQLFSFLFVTGLTDDGGNAERGASLFIDKECAICHRDGSSAPSPVQLGGAQSPLAFTESLWNHASAMQSRMRRRGVQWPNLAASDLRDLFAYLQSVAGKSGPQPVHIADAGRGWQLFQEKSCIDCHALRGRETSMPRKVTEGVAGLLTVGKRTEAPSLGGDSTLPPTLSEFGEVMLNHFPSMRRALNGRRPPEFAPGDLADLAVFLYSLRNTEPAGSPYVGASVFVWRGCAACHGEDASGDSAPALRGRGQTYTAIRLATGLWAHGNRMYEDTQQKHQPWPVLEDSDIGDLLAFLNTPLERNRQRH